MIYPTEIPRWKRMLDVVFILLILPFALPLAVLIAVLIRMVSDGPVLFENSCASSFAQWSSAPKRTPIRGISNS
jgi:Bacterial sugar transferase